MKSEMAASVLFAFLVLTMFALLGGVIGGFAVYAKCRGSRAEVQALVSWAETRGLAEYRLDKRTGKIEYFIDVDRLPDGKPMQAVKIARHIEPGMLLDSGMVFDVGVVTALAIAPREGLVHTWVWRGERWTHVRADRFQTVADSHESKECRCVDCHRDRLRRLEAEATSGESGGS